MGEVLVVAWELKQSKNFTQGRPKWAVVANHKLLTKLFGDRTLAEIENTKLFSLMQRTLPWYFEIMNMLGKTTQQWMVSRYTRFHVMTLRCWDSKTATCHH